LISSGYAIKNSRIQFFLKCTWIILQDDNILSHKSSLSKFKKIEIISSIFSDQNPEIRYQLQERTVKLTNTWRLNNMFLNNQEVTEEIKKDIKEKIPTNK